MIRTELWFIAGSNGSGKTTVAREDARQRKIPLPRILNADDYAAQHSVDAIVAAQAIDAELHQRILRNESVGVETVLSTAKYLLDAKTARSNGFHVAMIYVALESADLAVERVALRVAKGGHHVDEDKIRSRWERSHQTLGEYIVSDVLDTLFVFSNSGASPVLVANGERIEAENRFSIQLFNAELLPRITKVLTPLMSLKGI